MMFVGKTVSGLHACGALALAGLFCGVFAPRTAANATVAKTTVAPAERPLVVAADGSGNYKTVQEAVDAIPAGNSKRVVIVIKPGIYKAHLVIPKDKPFISLRGEDAAKTLLTNDLHVKSPGTNGKEVGTIGSASVVALAPDFTAENVTFENTAPHVAQALAIYVDADRAVFRQCRFLGWQDTIRVRSGRQYFDRCYINGRTDFIYGEATAFFDRCHIHVLEGGWITAANTPQDRPYGLVFSRCRITGEPGVMTYLGRPWRGFAHTVWLDTEMADVIRPEGWHNWNKPEAEKTVRYAEYNSKTPDGKPIDLSTRVSWAKRLSAEEAAKYTLDSVLGGTDGWNPAPSGSTDAGKESWTVPSTVRFRLVLAGDSTVTDTAGWGAGFKDLLTPEAECINLARGGRSSKSFRDEGHWSRALALRPDYVLLQFGHNDEPGKGPERETDPATTYLANMARYVEEARAAGIKPILVTSLSRRQFGPDGKIRSSLTPYTDTVRKLAADKKVPLLDLHTLSKALFEKIGPEGCKAISPRKGEGYDGTHLNRKGSEVVARVVVDSLRQAVPDLAPALKK